MFNVNGFKAVLIQNNRGESEYYDDQDKKPINIKVCPYNADMSVRFGTYTVQEAKGYFIVKSKTPVKTGDQLLIDGKMLSVIDVKDEWIWNKLANIIIAVK
jgi:hypothetical protein